MPLKVTLTPPRELGRGIEPAAACEEVSPEPKMETRDPGATGCPRARVAALTTPPSATDGRVAQFITLLRSRRKLASLN